MTLRGNAGRLVQGVNNLSGFVSLTEGPGIEIAPNNSKNSLQFSTVTATLEFDDILANGDSTARSAKFLNNASDTIPALIVHNTLDFGSGSVAPGVTLKYSPGTPDGLVIGPTTGTDKKILRTDIIGANTSSAIVAKSGMTFDTGLTLTVDNLVAKSVSNNGNITAHKLLPYDAAGVTIDLDNCTLTCADTVQDPRVSIYPGLNCYGYITGSAGAAISGDFILNNTISTPTIINPIDLTLKPSGNVKVFGGKSLFADILTSNTATDLTIQSAMNQNININTIGTGAITLSSVVTPVISGLASGAVSVNTRADFQSGIQTNTIRNQTSNLIVTTTGTNDITLNPGGKILVAAGKSLTVDNITSTNALSIASATNQNVAIAASGTGKVIVNNILNVDQINPNVGNHLTLAASPTAASGNIFLNANGTGQVISNKAFITSVIGSPSTFDLVLVPNTGKVYINGDTLTSNVVTNSVSVGTTNGNLSLSANGTGTINLNSTVIASSITTTTNGNLSLTPNGTGQVLIGSGKTLTADTIISKGITVNGNITTSKLLPYDLAGLSINLDTCVLTCADNVPSPMITINPQLLVNGTLNCMAGASFSGNVMINNEVTTPYNVTATDLKLNPTGNVRVIGNKTLFCNAISQNDTNTDLYLTAGGTNQNVVISPAGTGQVQVLAGKTLSADAIVSKGITVNGNVTAARLQPYDAAGLNIDLNACTLTCTDAVPNPQIIMSSPVLANILTVNTIRSADATNLTINSPGGTINTNATNITASGALSLASSGTLNLQASTGNSSVNISANGTGTINLNSPVIASNISNTNARLTLSAGTSLVYVTSPASFTNTIACSSYTNGGTSNIGISTISGNINISTLNAYNITITPGGTAITSFGGGGIKLPNGVSALNWYEEATISNAWTNVTTNTPTNTVTQYIVRISKQVFITLVSNNPVTPVSGGPPIMQDNLQSKFAPVATFVQHNYNNGNPYSVQITSAGVITIPNFVSNVALTPIMNFSYYTNAVTGSGASGQIDNTNGSSGSGDITGGGGSGSGDITGGGAPPGSNEPKP